MKEFLQSAPNVCICAPLGGKGGKGRRGRSSPNAFYLPFHFDYKVCGNPHMNLS